MPNKDQTLRLLLCLLPFLLSAAPNDPQDLIARLKSHTQERYPDQDFSQLLLVSVAQQSMYHLRDGKILRRHLISTALNGIGSRQHSFQTPPGLHRVCEKFGSTVPLGGIFDVRRYRGETAAIHTDQTDLEQDRITTRILWLCGMEPGVNQGSGVDSYLRHIYIHGTPEEGLLGSPASQGCIRMGNQEIVELFEAVPIDTRVLIVEW